MNMLAACNNCRKPSITCPVLSLAFFRQNSQVASKRFRELKSLHTYKKGNILFYQENRPLGLYFVCEGRVKLVKEDSRARNQIVRIVESPNLLGDRAFFAERPYACTAEAMEETRACFLETRHFWDLFGQDPEMLRLLTQRFARELGRAEDYLHCMAVCTINARVANYILTAAKRTNNAAPKKNDFIFKESRTELAQVLGTTIEAISRALANFRAKGMIALQGRRVRIMNENRLRQAGCSSHWTEGT